MIPDIKHANTSTTQSKGISGAVLNSGTISQLQSEIKLIQSIRFIKLQGSEQLTFQGKPIQLLQANNGQQQSFTLINTGPRISLENQQTAKMTPTQGGQVQLSLGDSKGTTHSTSQNLSPTLSVASRIITLTALAPSNQHNGSNVTPMSDGHNRLEVSTPNPLQKGEQVRVLLDTNNQLQVIPNKTQNAAPLSIDALKQSLPKQLNAAQMSQLISQLHDINSQSPSPLNAQSQRVLSQLIQGLPSLEQLTQSPNAMKQAIQNSGQFAEAQLKSPIPGQLNNDLKLNLTRLENSVSDSLRQVSFPTDQVANAIERITTHQLRHFTDSSQGVPQNYPLHLDLPIKDNQSTHLVQLHIDQETGQEDTPAHERRWLVKLNFDFSQTGRFEARMGIQENRVGIIFAAESPETIRAIKLQMDTLKQQLNEKNIEVQRLEAFQTKLQPTTQQQSPIKTSLIDVRT